MVVVGWQVVECAAVPVAVYLADAVTSGWGFHGVSFQAALGGSGSGCQWVMVAFDAVVSQHSPLFCGLNRRAKPISPLLHATNTSSLSWGSLSFTLIHAGCRERASHTLNNPLTKSELYLLASLNHLQAMENS